MNIIKRSFKIINKSIKFDVNVFSPCLILDTFALIANH